MPLPDFGPFAQGRKIETGVGNLVTQLLNPDYIPGASDQKLTFESAMNAPMRTMPGGGVASQDRMQDNTVAENNNANRSLFMNDLNFRDTLESDLSGVGNSLSSMNMMQTDLKTLMDRLKMTQQGGVGGLFGGLGV